MLVFSILHHRRLASLGLLSVLVGLAPSGGWCFRGVADAGAGAAEVRRLFERSSLFNSTDDLMLLLEERRLQAEEEEIGGNETATPIEAGLPANGCTICHGTTFMPNNIPNQNVLPELKGATCQVWQDMILPEWYPTGEGCMNDYFYQEFFIACCKLPMPRYQCEQNVHNLITNLEDYNIAVPPIVSHDEPLIVNTEVQFHYAEEIDVVSGTATVLASINMKWKDPRLAWTIDETNCADMINLWTGYNNEDTVIWVPDFDLINSKQGTQGFPATQAVVRSDGSVMWDIFGSLTAMCQFTGLSNIPFDTLGCQFVFGSRSRMNGNMIYFKFQNYDVISVGGFDMPYSEFTPVPELFQKGYTWYVNSDYAQAMYYNFFFRRAENFYVWNIVVPTIIFTYCSFFTYLLDMRVGERLGFGMALALVVVAAQIVTFDMIPVSSRRLWIDKLITWSFYWILVVLIQSSVVGFVFYLRDDYDAKEKGQRLSIIRATSRDSEILEDAGAAAFEDEGDDEGAANSESFRTDDDNPLSRKDSLMHLGNDDKSPAEPDKKPWYYVVSARKFDYICMLFSILSYTIFLIAMFVANERGDWIQNEPEWFDHDAALLPTAVENTVEDPYLGNITV